MCSSITNLATSSSTFLLHALKSQNRTHRLSKTSKQDTTSTELPNEPNQNRPIEHYGQILLLLEVISSDRSCSHTGLHVNVRTRQSGSGVQIIHSSYAFSAPPNALESTAAAVAR